MRAADQNRLLRQAADLRQTLFRSVIVFYDEENQDPNSPLLAGIKAYKSSSRHKQLGQEMGFLVPVDTIVRIAKSLFPPSIIPEVGKHMRVQFPGFGDEKLRIVEIPINMNVGIEWVSGCRVIL